MVCAAEEETFLFEAAQLVLTPVRAKEKHPLKGWKQTAVFSSNDHFLLKASGET